MLKKWLDKALHSALGSKRKHHRYSSSDHKGHYGQGYPNQHNQQGHSYYRPKHKKHSSRYSSS